MRSIYQLRKPGRVPNKRWFEGALARRAALPKAKPVVETTSAPLAVTPSGKDYYQQLEKVSIGFGEILAALAESSRYGPCAEARESFTMGRDGLKAQAGWITEHLTPLLRTKDQKFTLHDEPNDDLQAVLLSSSLGEFLRFDDGHMAARLQRVEEALDLLREHGPR